jgi:hypothetical protein
VLVTEFHHRHVRTADLVDFMEPTPEHGGAAAPEDRRQTRRRIALFLCDRWVRDVVTRQYLAARGARSRGPR